MRSLEARERKCVERGEPLPLDLAIALMGEGYIV
jgi:hypothetical protein